MNLEEYVNIYNYLDSLILPANLSMELQKKFIAKTKPYFIQHYQLYKRNRLNPDEPQQVVKINDVERILFNGHSESHSGHFGIENTYHRILRKYYWPQMYKTIENYIKACDICQRKGRTTKNNQLNPIPVREPFEKIGIDLVGPLPITSNNNRYIVVAIDYLTKWAEARAISDAAATTILPFLYEDIICHHGFSKEIISDRGTTFANELIKELTEKCQIKHRLSAPYHPQTNGLVERLNRTLCTSLAKYVQLYKQDWDHFLPSILFAYRTMRQNTTHFEPFYLTYGRQVITPIDIEMEPANQSESTLETEIVRRACSIIDKLEVNREIALQNIQKSQVKQKEHYDKNKVQKSFQIGDKVLMKRMETQHWHHDKFGEKWKDPYYIHNVFDKGTYKLRSMEGKVLKNPYNGDHLKLYIEKPALEPIIIIS